MFYNRVVRFFFSSALFSSALIVLSSYSIAASSAPSMSLCVSATSNGLAYVEAKQQIALQRKNAGGMSDQAYQNLLQTLGEQSQWLTIDMCMASLGEQVAIYHCLADNAGNFEVCAE
jgi:hypothetical protein